ncbi:hypothetical protein MSG28_014206 [Choristoneura fumiferana]|uniref:Uncharacterized protein n=1 Tax=Choristoneura fumiferana TaxID=7141 RepID=A0ACC0JG40_CHOFU|nr:hypothetical protein MSG28_014206 [Choristoneura fumiferana]
MPKDVEQGLLEVTQSIPLIPLPARNSDYFPDHLPRYQAGWTELHHASAMNLGFRIRVLLNADVIRMLLEADGTFNTMKGIIDNVDTPLHTAVEIRCLSSIRLLLDAGASVACLNSAGLTPLHLCVKCEDLVSLAERANTRDQAGFTLLQASVVADWLPGVCAVLDAGADVTATSNLPFHRYKNITLEDDLNLVYRLEQIHETPLHLAASRTDQEILEVLLGASIESVDIFNKIDQTPLYIALRGGHLSCVKALIRKGANIYRVSTENNNALHAAIQFGHKEVVEYILNYDDEATNVMIQSYDKRGYAPIHIAAMNNHQDCIRLLYQRNASLSVKTKGEFITDWTPLQIAASKNCSEVVGLILDLEPRAIDDVDDKNRTALHLAADRCHREVALTILRKGAVLSNPLETDKKRKTVIETISTKLPNSTQFFEEVFDEFIVSKLPESGETGCEISIDYGVLIKDHGTSQIKVLEELVRCGQKKILMHPLIESLIYLKWKTLVPFFYVIVAIYAIFALTLNFVLIVCFSDKNKESFISSDMLYAPLLLVTIQEFLFIYVKRHHYFLGVENWVKLGSLILALILLCADQEAWLEDEWLRHVATGALLLSWAHMTYLLSRFPYWGYYLLMFSKVASNIFKILLTCIFLLIAFSLSFMVQYHAYPPFDGAWESFIKTIVMMTSEYDYKELFGADHKELTYSKLIVHVLFVLFLILVSMVFMNFMIGVAVSDVADLKMAGDVRRLKKQVKFLSSLDLFVFGGIFRSLVHKKFHCRRFIKNIHIRPCVIKHWEVFYEVQADTDEPYYFAKEQPLPPHILDSILLKVKTKYQQNEREVSKKMYRDQMNLLFKTIVTDDRYSLSDLIENSKVGKGLEIRTKFGDIMDRLDALTVALNDVKDQVKDAGRNQQSVSDKNTQTDPIGDSKNFVLKLRKKSHN